MVIQANHDSEYMICKCGHDKGWHDLETPDICTYEDCPCKKFEAPFLCKLCVGICIHDDEGNIRKPKNHSQDASSRKNEELDSKKYTYFDHHPDIYKKGYIKGFIKGRKYPKPKNHSPIEDTPEAKTIRDTETSGTSTLSDKECSILVDEIDISNRKKVFDMDVSKLKFKKGFFKDDVKESIKEILFHKKCLNCKLHLCDCKKQEWVVDVNVIKEEFGDKLTK